MTKKSTKRSKTAAGKSASRHPNVIAYFEAKLEAEWGPFDLKHALDSNPQEILILDTRMPDAFEEEHLPQAVNIPGAELEKRLNELPKSKAIVPYCWNITCHLATRAALLLARKGYRVHELAGGIDRWKASEFPVVAGKREPALAR
jgi:rhodanese-related sulfurtransferase